MFELRTDIAITVFTYDFFSQMYTHVEKVNSNLTLFHDFVHWLMAHLSYGLSLSARGK